MAWSHGKWSSWRDFKIMMVRLFTQSEYSHVGLAIVLGGRVWVLEATIPHVRLVPLSNLLPCYHVTAKEFTAGQIENGLALVGKEHVVYSQLEAVKAYFGANNIHNDKVECAEIVNALSGYTCLSTPSAVVQHLLHNGSTLTEVSE